MIGLPKWNRIKNSFGRLTAPLGVFSTLGNHDYGDYVQWPTAQAKIDNLEALKKVHANMGWRLLMNEHVVLDKKVKNCTIRYRKLGC